MFHEYDIMRPFGSVVLHEASKVTGCSLIGFVGLTLAHASRFVGGGCGGDD
jgi:ABC-type Fe3+-siderophore transport system permease subunit